MKEQKLFLTTMPPTRKADYCLGYLEGSVFIDFDKYDIEKIQLKRISFDGYGCCTLTNDAVPLNIVDSQIFKNVIRNNLVDQSTLLIIVKKAISLNKNQIWSDALEEYYLV